MGLQADTILLLRDKYSKKIYIKTINEIIDEYNYEIWTNIGWCKIKEIQEEINFSQVYCIESQYGNLEVTYNLLNNIKKLPLPKQRIDEKWKLSHMDAFLLGYFLKYGILDNRFNLIIKDSSFDKKYLRRFLEIFDKVECVKSSFEKFNDNDNKYIIKNIYQKLIWNKYFSFCYNLNCNKIIPHVILNSDILIQTIFLLDI